MHFILTSLFTFIKIILMIGIIFGIGILFVGILMFFTLRRNLKNFNWTNPPRTSKASYSFRTKTRPTKTSKDVQFTSTTPTSRQKRTSSNNTIKTVRRHLETKDGEIS